MTDDRKFDPKKREKLNNPLRLEWVPPARNVQLMDLQAGGEYVDLGAGTGYLSRAIGEITDGLTIHALDIEPLMVEEMEATLGDRAWLKPVLMERDRLPFADSSINGLWSITVFHEFGGPEPILKEICRVLKPGGTVLVVDWQKTEEACEQGPPIDHRVAEAEVISYLQATGFQDAAIVDGFIHHFGVLAKKS